MEEEVEEGNKEKDEKNEDLKDIEIHIKEEKEEHVDMEDGSNEDGEPNVKTEIDDEKDKSSSEPDNEEEKTENMDIDDSEPIEIIEPLPRKIGKLQDIILMKWNIKTFVKLLILDNNVLELEEIDDSSDEENEDVKKKERPKIASTAKSEEKIPDDVPLIFDNVKVKEEPIDDDIPGKIHNNNSTFFKCDQK